MPIIVCRGHTYGSTYIISDKRKHTQMKNMIKRWQFSYQSLLCIISKPNSLVVERKQRKTKLKMLTSKKIKAIVIFLLSALLYIGNIVSSFANGFELIFRQSNGTKFWILCCWLIKFQIDFVLIVVRKNKFPFQALAIL